MKIRNATRADLAAVTDLERLCFPLAEAADEEIFLKRLAVFPRHFWLLESGGRLVCFVNGMVTSEPTIRDEMFADAALHEESGAWQAIFGVNTRPGYRCRGYAGKVLERVISDARDQDRAGCILTCKESLIPYYETFGFRSGGVSSSVHGGAVWYDMTLAF